MHETWAYTAHGVGASSRTLTAPLYLTLDALTDNHVAHYMPATFPANDERNCIVSNNRIDISHALSNAGTVEEPGKRRSFDYTLVEGDTHWPRGKLLTFGLEHRSLEHPGHKQLVHCLEHDTTLTTARSARCTPSCALPLDAVPSAWPPPGAPAIWQ